jgi:hypothetical protein
MGLIQRFVKPIWALFKVLLNPYGPYSKFLLNPYGPYSKFFPYGFNTNFE